METKRRLRADARIVDIDKRDLAVQLETGSRQNTVAPAPLSENSGLIDNIIISPDKRFASPGHRAFSQELSSIIVIFLVAKLRFLARVSQVDGQPECGVQATGLIAGHGHVGMGRPRACSCVSRYGSEGCLFEFRIRCAIGKLTDG